MFMQSLSESKRKCKHNHLSFWVSCRLLFFMCWSQIYSLMYNWGHSEKHAIIFVLARSERGSLEAALWHVSLGKLFWFLSYGMGSMFGLHHQSHRQKALWLCIKNLQAEHSIYLDWLIKVFQPFLGYFPKRQQKTHCESICSRHTMQTAACGIAKNSAIFQFPVNWNKNLYL